MFDASARCYSGQSLNDTLYVDPKLRSDVVDVLLGFFIAFTWISHSPRTYAKCTGRSR